MATIWQLFLIALVAASIAYFSSIIFVITILVASGVVVTALVRAAHKKDEKFQWPIVFHKGCATVHWAFISLYIYTFDRLRTDLPFTPVQVVLVLVIVSQVLYVVGGLTTRNVLDSGSPLSFLRSTDERKNALLAVVSLVVAVVFATVLTKD